MTEEKMICSECGTENEPQYIYCKNCGATLVVNNKKDDEEKATVQNNADYNSNNANYGSEHQENQNNYVSIDGIPIEDVQMFVGTKSVNIIPKFLKMEITGCKTSWIWPPAVLGFLFGPIGAAIWFFYRKMYKFAFVFVGIAALVSLITSLLTFNVTDVYLSTIFNTFLSGEFNEANAVMEGLPEIENSFAVSLASAIENISNITSCIIVGLFGCGWYKNHCIKKIKEFRMMNPNNNYYRLGLMSLGGTSGGMAALGVFILFGIGFLVSFTTIFLALLV